MAFIALAPFIGRRTKPLAARADHRPRYRRRGSAQASGSLLERIGAHLPSLTTQDTGHQPMQMTAALAVPALLALVALLGFWRRYRDQGEELDRWLALAATLTMFAEVHAVLTPLAAIDLRLPGRLPARGRRTASCSSGVWRAIRSAEFGRAVAEERARVAREIHDGLAAVPLRGRDARLDAARRTRSPRRRSTS